ncbi:phosphate/phosphite/phosphonate ABC transporter substrate-binding protein [Ureibacillus aquaedulcis]|uniref:Phosphate/phosphite/phosphonate ABC transporter substrate-binding protein n=1 Tax=Ureibacillus aquaedulcis TaxID=3058421 RepID=A0ABT8GUI7_9BACL|nr:phosphate/phosphite/phosphonate ABC transporter substrate-binding protein [Ureibacillus sp. BA0131]MDN4495078.1 phosphate/phosphite/phosphonate ABC transporter substrate-binding protein [Ureibacillus sp. BA0131]
MMRKVFLFLVISLLLASCKGEGDTLRIGMIPLKTKEDMLEEYKPVQEYLQDRLDLPVEFVVMESYVDLVENMKIGNIDIGYYGAFSYIAAESEMELIPLIVEQRKDIGIHYHSLILSSKNSSITSIDELEGRNFAFVDEGSTSGFVLPYALFKSRKIDMEQYFNNIHYSGSHGQVPVDIKDKVVDAGAISSIQYNDLIENGKIEDANFNIIWESDEIPGSPYVANAELDKKIQQKFTNAMLEMHLEIPGELKQLDSTFDKYVKIESKDYNSIRNIATILGKDYMVEYFLNRE